MSMIHQIDRPPPQVMIQVLIAEVSLDNRVELGLEFATQDLNFSENAVVGPNETIQGKDFDFVLGTDIGRRRIRRRVQLLHHGRGLQLPVPCAAVGRNA